MKFDINRLKAVVFDYGNTIIEFGPKQVSRLNDELYSVLVEMYGDCDFQRLTDVRKSQIIAPYANDSYIENNRREICCELIKSLYDIEPSENDISTILRVKQLSFLDAAVVSPSLFPLFEKLQSNYKLGFISNFPCSSSIRESLLQNGIIQFFDSVVVSAEVGVVKPHPVIFEKSLEELNLSAEECVYIGDNWLADIQGAKRMGMKAIHTTQYVSYEGFEPYPGDYQPDAVISDLIELEGLFL